MVIHGLLGTCSIVFKNCFLCACGFEKVFVWNFDLTLASVLKSVMKCFENFVRKRSVSVRRVLFLKEQVSKNYLPTRKKNRSMLISFRHCYPTIDE